MPVPAYARYAFCSSRSRSFIRGCAKCKKLPTSGDRWRGDGLARPDWPEWVSGILPLPPVGEYPHRDAPLHYSMRTLRERNNRRFFEFVRNAGFRVFPLAIAAISNAAPAQTGTASLYPARPIRLIVGFSAGGSSDTAARIAGQKLTEEFNQSVVIDNRTGANGAIAGELVAKAPADGYTLLMLTIAYATESALAAKLPYDIVRDFVPITQVTQQPYLVVVTPSLPARSIQDLIALAKVKPDQINYGSTGTGGSNHLTTELFNSAVGIRMAHIPFKGPPAALAAVVASDLQLMFSSIVSGLPLVRGGRLRALAVTSRQRSSVVPDVPAVAEAVPGFESVGWNGIVAPAGTSPVVIRVLARSVARGLQSADVKSRLAADGSEAVASAPEEFSRFLHSELARFSQVIRENRIRADR